MKTNVNDFTQYYDAPGSYHVTLVTNPNTVCADTVQKSFYVHTVNTHNPLFPNVFTPNHDGINDNFDFAPYVKCGNFQFEVFDRWGVPVMKTENKTFWDGRTDSGIAVSDGVYFFILKAGNNLYKGGVTVFK